MDGGTKTGQSAGNADPTDRGAGTTPSQAEGVLRARLRVAAGRQGNPTSAASLPPPAIPSLERGVALAVARAARHAGGLPASAEKVTPSGITLAELVEYLPEGSLIAIAEGAAERLGIVALCPAMIASLIEMQAMGRISPRAAVPRRATRTDAVIAADFVNALLAEISTGLAAHPMGAALLGFRYVSYLDDPRPLGLMLEDVGFHALSMTLRLGADGERTGQVFLAIPGKQQLPERPADDGDDPSVHIRSLTDDEAPEGPPTRQPLSAAVAQAPVPLAAILCRKSITLRELRALRPGATLNLTRGAIDTVQIETATGQLLATGQLGEAEGLYAVRLRGSGRTASEGATIPAQAPLSDSVPGSDSTGFDAFGDSTATQIGVGPDSSVQFGPPMSDLSMPDTFRVKPDEAMAEGALQPSCMAN